MKRPNLPALVLICAAALLVSCETSDQRQTKAMPPVQALAPSAAPLAAAAETSSPAPLAPAAPSASTASTQMPTDPVSMMLESAENNYKLGQANEWSGDSDSARQNFQDALKSLTSGPIDVKSDPRLQAELDKINARIAELDQDAALEAETPEQPSVSAPIDEANEITFPVDPNVKAKAEAELKNLHSDLPLVMNDYVASYINFYSTRGRGVLERALVRAGRYRSMIERVFQETGVPQDLIYLAQAESGFQPLALSRAGARGMWQFMSSRGKAYGLERNHWIDERQDPEKSTRAAAQHLKDLYSEFGDWYLAMAAYNSGPVNVQKGVQRTGFADFWELYKRDVLPKETKNYVPIILAMAIIAKNPAQYGIDAIQPDPPLAVDTVAIGYPVDLRLVAQCVGAKVEDIQQLNPSLLRLTTPADETFELRLPAGSKEKYEQAIAAIPSDKRLWWRYHQVASGETLASIARQYHVTAKAITQVNGLDADEITPETNLLIPIPAGHHAPGERESVAYSRRPTRYKVRAGDTVLSIAEDFGVSAASLRRWNHIKGDNLRKGRTLVIYRALPAGQKEVASRKSHKKKSLRAAAKPKSNGKTAAVQAPAAPSRNR